MSFLEQSFLQVEEDSTPWIFTDMIMSVVAILILAVFAFAVHLYDKMGGESMDQLLAQTFEGEFLGQGEQELTNPNNNFTVDGFAKNFIQAQLTEGVEAPMRTDFEFTGDTLGTTDSFIEFDSPVIDEEMFDGTKDQNGDSDQDAMGYRDGLKKGVDTDKSASIGSDNVESHIIGDSIYVLSRKSPHDAFYNIHVDVQNDGSLKVNSKSMDIDAVRQYINERASRYAVYIHLHVDPDIEFLTFETIKYSLWDMTYAAKVHALTKSGNFDPELLLEGIDPSEYVEP